MSATPNLEARLHILSIVEALTVTGPVKPLLMFSSFVGRGLAGGHRISHALMTTRRRQSAEGAELDPLGLAAEAAGVRYVTVPERRAYDFSVLSKILEGIRQIDPVLVETHDCKSHFLFYLLRLRHRDLHKLKWVAFHHGYTRSSLRVSLYQQLDRITLPSADQVITLCSPFAEMLARHGVERRRLTVISNAVEARGPPSLADVAKTRTAFGISPGEGLILTVGRLSREKGHEDLIRAFHKTLYTLEGQRIRLVIAGEGPERAKLERLAASLGGQVVFAGHIADPWPLFHAADVFVLPSHSEGSPLVIFEAMSARAAIVATNVGGVPEALTDSVSALLVPPRNPAALSEALCKLLTDKALRARLGHAAFEAVTNDFSAASYARKLLAVYDEILTTNGRRYATQ